MRLVQRLNARNTVFLIHVDKKTSRKIYQEMFVPLSPLSNVYFLERHECSWGDFGHVKATLKGIQEIYSHKIDFDYVILLTGQDYPIKSNFEIHQILQKNLGVSFIDYSPLPIKNWSGNGGLDRINYWHFFWKGKRLAFPKRDQFKMHGVNRLWNEIVSRIPNRHQFPQEFQLFGGGSYWCLSKESIQYIYQFVQHQKEFVDFFKFVFVPDEIFFHTILLNSPLKEKMINKDLRYVDWTRPKPPYPAILGKHNYDELISSEALFARKFDITVDADVLSMIDAVIS